MELEDRAASWRDREPTLDEELQALGEEDVFEMTNLKEKHTGVPGVIFISTAMGAHGPRVKYYLKAGGDQPSFSVAVGPDPRVLASSLDDRDVARMAPSVTAWVRLNHAALGRSGPTARRGTWTSSTPSSPGWRRSDPYPVASVSVRISTYSSMPWIEPSRP